MSRKYSLFAIIILILLIIGSCYYDNEETLYPTLGVVCDTSNVTFSGSISPMLANNCLSCHSNSTAASAGNGIRLQDYADVKTHAVAVEGSIKQSGTFSPMPKNGGKLKPCLIAQFDIWVKNGMPNN